MIPSGARRRTVPVSEKEPAAAKRMSAAGSKAEAQKQENPGAKVADKREEAVKIIEKPMETLLKTSEIEPNRKQPRKEFDEDALMELADSIKQYGVLQPILVQKRETYYEIVAGERRWRAAKLAGIRKIPVVIKEFTDQEIMEISLIENIQREDLNPIEEAKAYHRLIEEFHLKQDELADKVAKSRTTITNAMRLLNLSEKVQSMLIQGMLTTGHARAILGLTDEAVQNRIAMRVFDEKLSVRETERLVKEVVNPKKQKAGKEPDAATEALYRTLEEKIKRILGTKAAIHPTGRQKGKIEIEYYSPVELERIMDLIETIR